MSDLPFLTLYDPYELPGGTIDPLGFQRGYLRLSEEWLPGLTNAADRPRYVSMLCRGAFIADEKVKLKTSLRERRSLRIEMIKRYERMWVAACAIVLGAQGTGLGLRGITYARHVVGSSRIRLDYQLLGNQIRYGVIGIYAPMSVELGLLSDELAPTALGASLGDSFPPDDQVEEAAVNQDHGSISRNVLEEWGKKVRIDRISRRERELLKVALLNEKRRSLALQLICDTPTDKNELQRLRLVKEKLERMEERPEITNRILLLDAIVSFERFYRVSQFAFERMRWLASHSPSRSWNISEKDDELEKVLPRAVESGANMIRDLMKFNEVTGVAQQCRSPLELAKETLDLKDSGSWCKTLTDHHLGVQRGKFEGTLLKAPWVERKGESVIIGANRYVLDVPPSSVEEIATHPYKTLSADNYIRDSGMRT